MNYKRILQISPNYHAFLFGARGTGKTTWLQTNYQSEKACWFDLLDIELEDRFSRHPSLFIETINTLHQEIKYIVIDEIQKVPNLLNLIHQYIQKNPKRFIFLITGSSARKLRMSGANMLAGRAFIYNLFPLCYNELGEDFNLNEYLKYGGLPQVYQFKSIRDKNHYLRTYALSYLKEEVWAEHLIKNLDPFRLFLEVASQCNGDIINFSKISRQAGVTVKTIQSYFDILKETYIGFLLDAFHSSVRKRLIQSPKFFFFDPGIKRALDNTLQVKLIPGTYAYGKAFEHFVITQLLFHNTYYQKDYQFFYIKTKDGAELDLVIRKPDKNLVLVEIKSNEKAEEINVNTLSAFRKDFPGSRAYCLSRDSLIRKKNNINYLPWDKGIVKIFEKNK